MTGVLEAQIKPGEEQVREAIVRAWEDLPKTILHFGSTLGRDVSVEICETALQDVMKSPFGEIGALARARLLATFASVAHKNGNEAMFQTILAVTRADIQRENAQLRTGT